MPVHSQRSLIIIITGHPGTGKSSIGRALSDELGFPLFSKDEIKDRIFDTLGASDKTWSLKVSGAAYRIMDYIIGEELSKGHSLIVESNFKADIDSKRFDALKAKFNCSMVQILVSADGEVIFKRFMDRMRSPERNPGHVEALDEESIRKSFLEPYPPLRIDGQLIEIDTTDFGKVDTKSLAQDILQSRTNNL